jgi:hypothetical protein
MSVKGPAPSVPLGGRRALSGAPGLTYPDNNAQIPRDFTDGYVHPDMWTGDSGVPEDRQGMTWNWGAGNPSQYNYDGGDHPTLTFHIDQGEYAGGSYRVSGGKSDDDMPTEGIEVRFSHLLHSWTSGEGTSNNPNPKVNLDMSLVFGLAFFPEAKQSHYRSAGRDVFHVTESYTYQDYYGSAEGGSYPPLSLPYSGSYGTIGGSDAGPLIPVTPESSELSTTQVGSYRNNVELDCKIWRLRGAAGLEFAKPLTERLDVYVAPQLVVEFIDMSAERTETVSYNGMKQSSTSDSKSKMTVVPGVLITAGADYRFSKNWYAGASVGWEWLVEDPSMRVGPDKVQYDLNGGEFSLYVGRSF